MPKEKKENEDSDVDANETNILIFRYLLRICSIKSRCDMFIYELMTRTRTRWMVYKGIKIETVIFSLLCPAFTSKPQVAQSGTGL